jgi:hypothetical protein
VQRAKSDLLLYPGSVAIVLAKIQRALPKFRAALEQRQAEVRLDKLFRMAAIGVERNDFSASDLLKMMNQLTTEKEVLESTHRVVATPHAHANARASQRHIDFKVLYDAVTQSLRSGGTTQAKRLPNSNRYMIRGPNSLRIVYEVKADTIVILTAYHKAAPPSGLTKAIFST